MPTRVASFHINCTACLDASGSPIGKLPEFARNRKTLVQLYSAMVKTRSFDAKAIALQRTGRLGTYASSLGQEAIAVGVASAMSAQDVLLPSFREHGAQLWRGVSLEELLLYWGGDERGNNFAKAKQDFPVCIPVASQFPHAAGVALAMVQKGETGAAVAIAGDGATSKGDFYEALNVVGAWNLPVVFVINNNQWAISVRREDQTAAKTLAQKAIAAGIPGEQVDGNDVIAVRTVTQRALTRARADKGASLIECLSYRLGDHTTADDASRYREDEAVSARWKEEPLIRLRNFLVAEHGWSKEDEESLLGACGKQVDKAAENYLAIAPQATRTMFDNLFGRIPADITALMKEIGGV
jgi:2-oxoisovalerate dehydrogenase E1 component alpha subunit